MKYSISLKLSLLFALFGLLASGLTGYYSYSSSRDLLINGARRDLQAATQVFGRNLQLGLRNHADNLRLLARLPLPQAVLNHDDLTSKEALDLAQHFKGLLQLRPEVLHIRLIGADQYGRERLRLDKDSQGNIQLVPRSELLEKGHNAYVFDTLNLPPDNLYYSAINFDQESSHVPVLRMAIPIWPQQGTQAIGLIALDLDVQQLFTQLRSELPADYQLYLAGPHGELLLHPSPEDQEQADNGTHLLQEEIPALAPLLDGRSNSLLVRLPSGHGQSERLAAFSRRSLDEQGDYSEVILGLTLPSRQVLHDSDQLGLRILQIVCVLALLALLFASLLARAATHPLSQITRAINRFSVDRTQAPLPITREDELGVLARNLAIMQQELLKQFDEQHSNRLELERLAQHDPLTGLPNRRLFFERLNHALANAKRHQQHIGLLFVDLDHFKNINDTHGHALGDEVLCQIAKLLRSVTREADTVARLGGDEFVVLCEQVENLEGLNNIARKLWNLLQSPLLIGGHQLSVQASLGLALYPEHGDDPQSLLQNADRAMYQAKHSGRNRVAQPAADDPN